MIYPFKQLIGCELHYPASLVAGSVVGFLIDDEAWALPYISVQLPGEAQAAARLLPSSAFPPIGDFNGKMVACLTPEEVSHGFPLTGTCEEVTRSDQVALHDALHWQPYWFEYETWVPHPLHDAATAIGARLSCSGKPFGVVEDLLVDTRRWTVHALCIKVENACAGELVQLSSWSIRSADWKAKHFDCNRCAAATSDMLVPTRRTQGVTRLGQPDRRPSKQQRPA